MCHILMVALALAATAGAASAQYPGGHGGYSGGHGGYSGGHGYSPNHFGGHGYSGGFGYAPRAVYAAPSYFPPIIIGPVFSSRHHHH